MDGCIDQITFHNALFRCYVGWLMMLPDDEP